MMAGLGIRGAIFMLSDCLGPPGCGNNSTPLGKGLFDRTHTVVNDVKSTVTLSVELMRVAIGSRTCSGGQSDGGFPWRVAKYRNLV